MADFLFQNHGSICLLTPLTAAATQWVEDNVGEHQTFGAAVVVEHRYARGIVEGVIDDGLTVE